MHLVNLRAKEHSDRLQPFLGARLEAIVPLRELDRILAWNHELSPFVIEDKTFDHHVELNRELRQEHHEKDSGADLVSQRLFAVLAVVAVKNRAEAVEHDRNNDHPHNLLEVL